MSALSLTPALALCVCLLSYADGLLETRSCDIRAYTTGGWVCGLRRLGPEGTDYASFRGVPYAKQPVGALRFKELQPVERWNLYYDASEEGPVCPQHDVLYGRLTWAGRTMSEACIHANIHVPLAALPATQFRPTRGIQPPYTTGYIDSEAIETGLPILVFIHGGGFAFGSGDTDIHGPEHLVSKGVIVITFNYRLNVFGFLSLNSSSVPGNNGLRDMITLLKWVQENAHNFGGNANDVTLAGQSAGAAAAHLLSLSPAAKGLFHRVILMSGTAISSFFTTVPAYAQYAAGMFLSKLGINATENPDLIHKQLVETPLEKLMDINAQLQDETGLALFFPVVESPLAGVTSILEDDPERLIAKGRGNNLPTIVGYTNAECEIFRPAFEKLNTLSLIKENPLRILFPSIIFSTPLAAAQEAASKFEERYFNGSATMDKYVTLCSEGVFEYPALKVAQYRQLTGGAPMFLYQFSYEPEHSVLKKALRMSYKGAAHVEDLPYVFQVNSVPVLYSKRDDDMRQLMTMYFINFMQYNCPVLNIEWPPIAEEIRYEDIASPELRSAVAPSQRQWEFVAFFDSILQGNQGDGPSS